MRIKYSKDVDILMVELSDKPIDHAEEAAQIIIHFTEDDEPVLIEIQDAKEFVINSVSSLVRDKEVVLP